MSRRPRIAWVVPTLSTGGTEVQLLRLMEGLADEFELTLVCTRGEGALIGDARRAGAWVRVLGVHSGWDFRTAPRLIKAFHRHTPDVVHSFLFGFDWHALHAAKRVGAAGISSRREIQGWQKARHRWMLRRGNRLADAVVANSIAVRDDAVTREGADATKFHVIYNGIDAEEFTPPQPKHALRARYRLPDNKRVIGMAANFSAVKDHAFFLQVVEQLLAKRDDLHFLLVGAGPLRDTIARQIRRRGWDAHCTIRSTASEMRDLYGAMDISILCSQREGFPNVLMESMAAGLPVVAPAVGGIPELIQQGNTGMLVEPRTPEKIVEAITHLLNHPENAQAIADRGAAWVREHLDVHRMIDAYRGLYIKLIEEKRDS